MGKKSHSRRTQTLVRQRQSNTPVLALAPQLKLQPQSESPTSPVSSDSSHSDLEQHAEDMARCVLFAASKMTKRPRNLTEEEWGEATERVAAEGAIAIVNGASASEAQDVMNQAR